MAWEALVWILLAALVVYGAAAVLASLRWVHEGHVGIFTSRSGRRRVLTRGVHVVNPFGGRTVMVPKGPLRMDGEVRNAVTQDGWTISAHYQMNARLLDEMALDNAGDDWRVATRDAADRVLRTELENNEAKDLRPRPQALDAGVAEEINVLTRGWGVEVDWLRVTIRWAYAIPPVHPVDEP